MKAFPTNWTREEEEIQSVFRTWINYPKENKRRLVQDTDTDLKSVSLIWLHCHWKYRKNNFLKDICSLIGADKTLTWNGKILKWVRCLLCTQSNWVIPRHYIMVPQDSIGVILNVTPGALNTVPAQLGVYKIQNKSLSGTIFYFTMSILKFEI